MFGVAFLAFRERRYEMFKESPHNLVKAESSSPGLGTNTADSFRKLEWI